MVKPIEKKYLNKSQEKLTSIANRKPKLIIRNLTFTTTSDDLTQLFKEFGNIVEVKVPLKQNGKPTGFGFIEFTDVKAAEQAVEKINGNQFDGRTIAVDWSVPKDKFEKSSLVDTKKITQAELIKNEKTKGKDQKATLEAKILSSNNKIGKISSVEIEEEEFEMIDVDLDTSDEESGDKSGEELDINDINASKIEEEKNPFAIGVEEQTTLFIRNLSFDTVEEDLADKYID